MVFIEKEFHITQPGLELIYSVAKDDLGLLPLLPPPLQLFLASLELLSVPAFKPHPLFYPSSPIGRKCLSLEIIVGNELVLVYALVIRRNISQE